MNNDRSYFARRTRKYHMFKHPEMPSYEDQIAARDRMLAKHPDLRFVGAHLASLEWSVDRLGEFFDRFPNALADTAARMGQLQYQSNREREKVRRIFSSSTRTESSTARTTRRPLGRVPAGRGYERTHAASGSHTGVILPPKTCKTVPELDDPVPGPGPARGLWWKRSTSKNAKKLFPKAWQ